MGSRRSFIEFKDTSAPNEFALFVFRPSLQIPKVENAFMRNKMHKSKMCCSFSLSSILLAIPIRPRELEIMINRRMMSYESCIVGQYLLNHCSGTFPTLKGLQYLIKTVRCFRKW